LNACIVVYRKNTHSQQDPEQAGSSRAPAAMFLLVAVKKKRISGTILTSSHEPAREE
jgi:hypothetical protein